MTAWTDADAALLIEWVKMCAPLFADGASDAAVTSSLTWQMQLDLADRSDAGIRNLIAQWAPGMHQAAAEIGRLMRDR